jgi:fatty acid desaturase
MSVPGPHAPSESSPELDGVCPAPAPGGKPLSAVQAEIFAIHQALLAEPGWNERFLQLQRPRTAVSLSYIATAWLGLLLTWALMTREPLLLLPVALLLMASLQRLLGNNLHDASHGNILRDGEALFEVLLAAPMFENFRHYRALHLKHHAYLHESRNDPDHLPIPFRPEDGEEGPSALKVYLRTLCSWRAWKGNFLGELPALGWSARARIALWWAVVLGGLAAVAGPGRALAFAGLWLASRATTYHALKVFTELADHSGLEVGSVLSYTRNSPRNALSLLIHPYGDNYHLTHHLAPRVPMPNLHATHLLLWGVPAYRVGYHCDGYLFGRYPVMRSWLRAWRESRGLDEPRRFEHLGR